MLSAATKYPFISDSEFEAFVRQAKFLRPREFATREGVRFKPEQIRVLDAIEGLDFVLLQPNDGKWVMMCAVRSVDREEWMAELETILKDHGGKNFQFGRIQ